MVFVSMPTLAAFRKVPFGPDGLAKGRSMKLLVNTCTISVPPSASGDRYHGVNQMASMPRA